jgi:hypothetical protein
MGLEVMNWIVNGGRSLMTSCGELSFWAYFFSVTECWHTKLLKDFDN